MPTSLPLERQNLAMKNSNWVLWVKILFMLVALAGIFSAMSYFRSGAAFKEQNSAAQILLGNPAAEAPRPAKVLHDRPEQDAAPAQQPDPQNH